MNEFLKDLRYALRTLAKTRGFSFIAILTLALGIGASSAIFTAVDASLLRDLPYKTPERLYHLWESTPRTEFSQREFSYPDYLDYQQNQVSEGIAAYTGGGAILTSRGGEPERVFAPSASANFFSVLGVDALIGRTFRAGEDKPGSPRVVVLSFGLWQSRFGGDAGIVGQALTLDGATYTVIGILPQTFQFALRPNDLWRAYQPTDAQLTRRFMHGTNLIARLKNGVTVEQAHAALSVIASRIEQGNKDSHTGMRLRMIPLREQIVGPVKPILMVLLSAVGFVLLIACANVASLLLMRSIARQKEVAIRAALGASGWRVIRQLLTESVLLSVVAGAVGLLFANWVIGAFVSLLPDSQTSALPFLKTLHIDGNMLAFSFGLSLVTGIVFGTVPALQSARVQLNDVLREGGRSTTVVSSHRLRSAFVIAEVALAVVLLVGAGLLMKSLLRLLQTSPGFNPENVLTMTVVLPNGKYAKPDARVVALGELMDRVRSLPGVKGAGNVDNLPLQGGNTTTFYVEGDPIPPPDKKIEANFRVVDEAYFQTLGVPVVAGRAFDERDNANAPSVVIIGKTVADKLFRGRNPIGRRLVYGAPGSTPDVIVGVVGDIKIAGLDEAFRPVIYSPYRQSVTTATNLVVRTNGDPGLLAGLVRTEILNLEPEAAVFNVDTMEHRISDSSAAFMRRFPAVVISLFAGLALLLSSIGIYGVVSYSVRQQTHYIGIRMALGARAADILRMVMREGLILTLAGATIGVAAAFGLMRMLASLLFEVQTTDATTFGLVVGAVFTVTLMACYIPARRATKVDPLTALRCD